MKVLLIIRAVYTNEDDHNVVMDDGSKIFYKNLLVLEFGKILANLKHDIEITTLQKILDTNDPLNYLNKFDLIIKYSLRDTIYDKCKNCYLKKSKADVVFFDAPIIFRDTTKSLKHHRFIRIMVNDNFGNNNFIKKYHQKTSRLSNINLKFKDWQVREGYILIVNQLLGDTAIDPINPYDWLEKTIIQIRKITSKQILVRDHPLQLEKDKYTMLEIVNKYNINLSVNNKIKDDLDLSQVCVTFSSGSAIDSLIEGVPVITTDKRSFAYEVCDNEIKNILNPLTKNRTKLFESLSNIHWEFKEIQNAKAWSFFSSFIKIKK